MIVGTEGHILRTLGNGSRTGAERMGRMRVALIGLQSETSPPVTYGAVGRAVASLATSLRPRVDVVPVVAEGSGLSLPTLDVPFVGRRGSLDPEQMAPYSDILSGCDVVHNHDAAVLEWLEGHVDAPIVTTLHTNRLPAASSGSQFAYLSRYQAEHLRWVGFAGWGRPIITPPDPQPGPSVGRSRDLLVLGQLRPEKGITDACQVAAHSGRRLVLAGPLARRHRQWFESNVACHIEDGCAVYVGEVADPERLRLLQASAALLFCSRPAEPLGRVMVEAMAAGTPVLALDSGACNELVVDGVSGFVRGDVASLAAAVDDLAGLHPGQVSSSVDRFAPGVVVEEHLRMYRKVARLEPTAAEKAGVS